MSSTVWFHTFDDQFWILIGGMVIGLFTILAKNKCVRCALCFGCIEVNRDVQAELAAARLENHTIRPNGVSGGSNSSGSSTPADVEMSGSPNRLTSVNSFLQSSKMSTGPVQTV